MEFISIRDLRSKISSIWESLSMERELIITSNGKPKAILIPIEGRSLEEDLRAIRRARAKVAVLEMQRISVEKGLDKLSLDQINEIIKDVRRKNKK